MGCLGVHVALTEDEASPFVNAESDEKLLELWWNIEEEAFDNPGSRPIQETDKSWDAMHRALTDGTLRIGRHRKHYPFTHVILGGQWLHEGDNYIVVYKTPREVQDVAKALGDVNEADFRECYFRIDPDDYGMLPDEQDYAYTWDWFTGVRDFYQEAAARGWAVLFAASQ